MGSRGIVFLYTQCTQGTCLQYLQYKMTLRSWSPRYSCNFLSMAVLSSICAMVKSRALLGMGDLPPLTGNPYNGYIYINPYYWVDDHPYYMEIMGV